MIPLLGSVVVSHFPLLTWSSFPHPCPPFSPIRSSTIPYYGSLSTSLSPFQGFRLPLGSIPFVPPFRRRSVFSHSFLGWIERRITVPKGRGRRGRRRYGSWENGHGDHGTAACDARTHDIRTSSPAEEPQDDQAGRQEGEGDGVGRTVRAHPTPRRKTCGPDGR